MAYLTAIADGPGMRLPVACEACWATSVGETQLRQRRGRCRRGHHDQSHRAQRHRGEPPRRDLAEGFGDVTALAQLRARVQPSRAMTNTAHRPNRIRRRSLAGRPGSPRSPRSLRPGLALRPRACRGLSRRAGRARADRFPTVAGATPMGGNSPGTTGRPNRYP